MKYKDDYSQHFLQNIRIVKELIGHTTIKKSDIVLDLGAGSGIITAALAPQVQSVVSVENEPDALKKLRANVGQFTNVDIIENDILSFVLPTSSYKVFSNIPFHLSSAILRHLSESNNPPAAIYLILQKQFARKLLLESDFFKGMLGAQITPLYAARIRRPLRRTDFWPPPRVDTVLLELKLRSEPLIKHSDMPEYRSFVEQSFHDPLFFKATRIPSNKKDKPSQMKTRDWIQTFLDQPITNRDTNR